MAQNVRIAGATYSNVPSIDIPKSTSGTASFFDVSDTTAGAADVASGKYFYTAAGVLTAGTASGGGVTVKSTSKTVGASNATSLAFTGLTGEPKMWAVQFVKTSGSYLTYGTTRYLTSIISDGTNIYSTTGYRSSNTGRDYIYTTCTASYSSGTLTITSEGSTTTGYFVAGTQYRLIYAY